MGCACEKTQGFKQKLSLAKEKTQSTGKIHVIFVMKAVGQVFVCKESELTDELGICCYFLPDGTEVEYIFRNKSKTSSSKYDNREDVDQNLSNKFGRK